MKILKVFGDDDYAALHFDAEFDIKTIIQQMEDHEVSEYILETKDGEIIYTQLLEFDTPEELFEYYKSEMQDYDDSKHTNYYRK
jgi:hypothetical protein